MKKITLTEEQEKEYIFAKDIIELINKYKGEELLKNIDAYICESMEYAAELFAKEILLGHTSLVSPDEWDDWTEKEKEELFNRWGVIDKLVYYSKLKLQKEEKEDDYNYGGGLIN